MRHPVDGLLAVEARPEVAGLCRFGLTEIAHRLELHTCAAKLLVQVAGSSAAIRSRGWTSSASPKLADGSEACVNVPALKAGDRHPGYTARSGKLCLSQRSGDPNT